MRDAGLELRQDEIKPLAEDEPTAPAVVVVASGKGGVGKSLVSVLLADALAESGRRVLLFDGAQNLGHLHVLLGVSPTRRLDEVVRGEVEPDALLIPIKEGLWLAPSDSGAESLYALPALDQARLHHRLSALYHGFDLVVVDAGAGVEGAIRLANMGGTRMTVVIVPEAAALTDAYALIKLVHAQLPTLPIDVIVNRTGGPEDTTATFERLATAAERFLGRTLSLTGSLPEVPALRETLRRPGGMLTDPALAALRHDAANLSRLTLATLTRESGAAANGRPA